MTRWYWSRRQIGGWLEQNTFHYFRYPNQKLPRFQNLQCAIYGEGDLHLLRSAIVRNLIYCPAGLFSSLMRHSVGRFLVCIYYGLPYSASGRLSTQKGIKGSVFSCQMEAIVIIMFHHSASRSNGIINLRVAQLFLLRQLCLSCVEILSYCNENLILLFYPNPISDLGSLESLGDEYGS